MFKQPYHRPVLLNEVIAYLAPKPGGVYVDVTLGGGGHTRALLEAEPTCKVIGIDWDQKAIELNAPALEQEFGDRFKAIWGNFAQLPLLFKRHKLQKVDGIVADFGTSQFQITHQPGFSFAQSTPLDMRMSPAHQRYTAYELINKASEKELAYIFYEYGQETYARRIARALVEARKEKPIKTTGQLVDIITSVIPKRYDKRIHPATKSFQALRIAINKELANIQALLKHALHLLVPGGRLVCISFHSLEDGLVKRFLREHEDCFTVLTPKAVMAQPDEVKANPSARSARLRAAELKDLSI